MKNLTEESLFGEKTDEKSLVKETKSLSLLKKRPRKNAYVKEPSSFQTQTDSEGNTYYVDENGNRKYFPPLLPSTYTDRDFLSLANTYDVNDLTGGIVKIYDENDDEKLYKLADLDRYAKDTKIPETEPIENGVIYNEKINKSVNFSASYLIANLSVNNEKLKEIIVTDISRTNLKLGGFDTKRLKDFYSTLDEQDNDKYFVIKSVVLSVINHRDFSKTEFKAGVDGQFFNAGGETYSSSEIMKSTRTVSVDLIALKDVF